MGTTSPIRLDTLKKAIPILKKIGAEVGMEISEEDISARMKLSRVQFDNYLNADGKTPGEVMEILSRFWPAWPELLTKGSTITHVHLCEVEEDDPDEDP